MRKREQLLWDAMKRNLSSALWLQRIENLVGDGMPDVYVGRSGKWVELKAPSKVPARRDTPLLGDKEGLRLSQINWHTKHASMGNVPFSYILIRTVSLELLLLPGSAAATINDLSLTELRAISYPVFGWAEIEQELK